MAAGASRADESKHIACFTLGTDDTEQAIYLRESDEGEPIRMEVILGLQAVRVQEAAHGLVERHLVFS